MKGLVLAGSGSLAAPSTGQQDTLWSQLEADEYFIAREHNGVRMPFVF